MNEEIGSNDAKKKLPEILHRGETGECFTITSLGKPVTDLIPSRSGEGQRVEGAIANILKAKNKPRSVAEHAGYTFQGLYSFDAAAGELPNVKAP